MSEQRLTKKVIHKRKTVSFSISESEDNDIPEDLSDDVKLWEYLCQRKRTNQNIEIRDVIETLSQTVNKPNYGIKVKKGSNGCRSNSTPDMKRNNLILEKRFRSPTKRHLTPGVRKSLRLSKSTAKRVLNDDFENTLQRFSNFCPTLMSTPMFNVKFPQNGIADKSIDISNQNILTKGTILEEAVSLRNQTDLSQASMVISNAESEEILDLNVEKAKSKSIFKTPGTKKTKHLFSQQAKNRNNMHDTELCQNTIDEEIIATNESATIIPETQESQKAVSLKIHETQTSQSSAPLNDSINFAGQINRKNSFPKEKSNLADNYRDVPLDCNTIQPTNSIELHRQNNIAEKQISEINVGNVTPRDEEGSSGENYILTAPSKFNSQLDVSLNNQNKTDLNHQSILLQRQPNNQNQNDKSKKNSTFSRKQSCPISKIPVIKLKRNHYSHNSSVIPSQKDKNRPVILSVHCFKSKDNIKNTENLHNALLTNKSKSITSNTQNETNLESTNKNNPLSPVVIVINNDKNSQVELHSKKINEFDILPAPPRQFSDSSANIKSEFNVNQMCECIDLTSDDECSSTNDKNLNEIDLITEDESMETAKENLEPDRSSYTSKKTRRSKNINICKAVNFDVHTKTTPVKSLNKSNVNKTNQLHSPVHRKSILRSSYVPLVNVFKQSESNSFSEALRRRSMKNKSTITDSPIPIPRNQHRLRRSSSYPPNSCGWNKDYETTLPMLPDPLTEDLLTTGLNKTKPKDKRKTRLSAYQFLLENEKLPKQNQSIQTDKERNKEHHNLNSGDNASPVSNEFPLPPAEAYDKPNEVIIDIPQLSSISVSNNQVCESSGYISAHFCSNKRKLSKKRIDYGSSSSLDSPVPKSGELRNFGLQNSKQLNRNRSMPLIITRSANFQENEIESEQRTLQNSNTNNCSNNHDISDINDIDKDRNVRTTEVVDSECYKGSGGGSRSSNSSSLSSSMSKKLEDLDNYLQNSKGLGEDTDHIYENPEVISQLWKTSIQTELHKQKETTNGINPINKKSRKRPTKQKNKNDHDNLKETYLNIKKRAHVSRRMRKITSENDVSRRKLYSGEISDNDDGKNGNEGELENDLNKSKKLSLTKTAEKTKNGNFSISAKSRNKVSNVIFNNINTTEIKESIQSTPSENNTTRTVTECTELNDDVIFKKPNLPVQKTTKKKAKSNSNTENTSKSIELHSPEKLSESSKKDKSKNALKETEELIKCVPRSLQNYLINQNHEAINESANNGSMSLRRSSRKPAPRCIYKYSQYYRDEYELLPTIDKYYEHLNESFQQKKQILNKESKKKTKNNKTVKCTVSKNIETISKKSKNSKPDIDNEKDTTLSNNHQTSDVVTGIISNSNHFAENQVNNHQKPGRVLRKKRFENNINAVNDDEQTNILNNSVTNELETNEKLSQIVCSLKETFTKFETSILTQKNNPTSNIEPVAQSSSKDNKGAKRKYLKKKTKRQMETNENEKFKAVPNFINVNQQCPKNICMDNDSATPESYELFRWVKELASESIKVNNTENYCDIGRYFAEDDFRITDINNMQISEKDGVEYAYYSEERNKDFGYIKFKSGSVKQKAKSKTYDLFFLFMFGSSEIEIGGKVHYVKAGNFVAIPKGIYYSIANKSAETSCLFFIKVRKNTGPDGNC